MISEIDLWAALCDDGSTTNEKIEKYEHFYNKPCALLSQIRPYPVSRLVDLNNYHAVKPDFLNDIYYPVNP